MSYCFEWTDWNWSFVGFDLRLNGRIESQRGNEKFVRAIDTIIYYPMPRHRSFNQMIIYDAEATDDGGNALCKELFANKSRNGETVRRAMERVTGGSGWAQTIANSMMCHFWIGHFAGSFFFSFACFFGLFAFLSNDFNYLCDFKRRALVSRIRWRDSFEIRNAENRLVDGLAMPELWEFKTAFDDFHHRLSPQPQSPSHPVEGLTSRKCNFFRSKRHESSTRGFTHLAPFFHSTQTRIFFLFFCYRKNRTTHNLATKKN